MVGWADAAPWRLAVYLVQLSVVHGAMTRSYLPPDAFVFHRLHTSISCARRWLLSCGSFGARSSKYGEVGFYNEYILLQEKGEAWWFRRVARKQNASVSSLHWGWWPKLCAPWYFHAPVLFKGCRGNARSLCQQDCHLYQVPQFGLSGAMWAFTKMLDIAGLLLTNQMSLLNWNTAC